MKLELITTTENWDLYYEWKFRIEKEFGVWVWKIEKNGWQCGNYFKTNDKEDITIFSLYKIIDNE